MQKMWKKLNLKDHDKVVVLNAPNSFEGHIRDLGDVNLVRQLESNEAAQFILAFVTSRSEIKQITSELISNTIGDVIVWFSYPKGTSKKYSCDFNRDNGWEPLLDLGFTGFRQVAIDEDWSALRFRRSEYVKSTK